LEEIEVCQRQVDQKIENAEIYKSAINDTISEADVQVADTLDVVDGAKVFMKWTLPLYKQINNYYMRNSILRKILRVMKQQLEKARRQLKNIKQ